MNKLKDIISKHEFNSLITNYTFMDLCRLLNFNELMHLVEHLFYDDIQNDEIQQYALRLAFAVKDQYDTEWKKDWKNDIFLGGLCEMLWLYDERYVCYKRAFDTLEDPPAELLLLLANCNSAPGTPPISDEEASFYLNEAANKKLTCETALALRSYFKLKGNTSKESYWNNIFDKLKKDYIHLNPIVPDVLVK